MEAVKCIKSIYMIKGQGDIETDIDNCWFTLRDR